MSSMPLGLHIPDGFLTLPVTLAWWVLTIIALGFALRQVGATLHERQIPLMGVMAAFIFAAQMLNFPVLGGTSGHLLGGALAALLLGPWAAVVRFASILLKSWLSVQAALLLTATTHFTHVLYALRTLRLPPILVTILSFAYRYLFVMLEEAHRMLLARESRSAEIPGQRSGGSIIWRARVVGQMVGTLFIRAYERSERIYLAMLARGFTGEIRLLRPTLLSQREQGIRWPRSLGAPSS